MTTLILLLTLSFVLLGIYTFITLYKNKQNQHKTLTRCIICGTPLNTSQLTTCSKKCNTIAQSVALNYAQRLRSNVSRQKHISGFEMSYYEWLDTVNYFNSQCAYCSKHLNTDSIVMDHFIPVSLGGFFTFRNILPSCHFCNSSKSNTNPFDFINSIPNSNKYKLIKFITNR